MNYRSIAVALAASTLLAACATFSPPPPRPAYTGSDAVDQLDPSGIVGTWSMRVLNPREGEELPDQVMRFNADGTAVGQMKNLPGLGELDDLEFQSTGNWTIAGDIVTTSNIKVEEVSGNGLGGFMTAIVNSQSKKMAGTANVMEASADRMVWAWSGDGTVMEYTRIE